MKLFVVVAVCFCFGAGGGPVSFRAVKGECFESALELGVKLFAVAVCFCFGAGGGPVSFRAVKLFVVVCFCFGAGGGPVSFRAVKLFVVVCFCFGAGGGPVSFGVRCETVRRRRRRRPRRRRLFLFWGGRGASQLPGCEGGRGASQLWSLVVSPSVFVLVGGRGPVSFGVWWCRRRRRRRCAVCFCFGGGKGASQLWSLVSSSPSPLSSPSSSLSVFVLVGGRGPVSFRAVKGEGGPVSFGVWWCRRLFLFWWGEGGQSALEFGGVVVAVAVCFCFGGGEGASQLPGCEGRMF